MAIQTIRNLLAQGHQGWSRYANDYWLTHALKVIQGTYGDVASVGRKNKDLLKFGHNESIGTTKADIARMPGTELHETYVNTNAITHIVSSAADTQEMKIEGHTIDANGDFTFKVQTVTLTGVTHVALPTPLARVTRAYNNGTVALTGAITVSEGTTPTDAQIHLLTAAGEQQSEKASTTISKNDYWILTSIYGDVLEKTSAFADITLEVREKGKIFRPVVTLSASNSGRGVHEFKPYHIVPANSDVRLVAAAGAAGTEVSGGIQGILAIVT